MQSHNRKLTKLVERWYDRAYRESSFCFRYSTGYSWVCYDEWYLYSKNYDYLLAFITNIKIRSDFCAKFSGIEKCGTQRWTSADVSMLGGSLLIYYDICLERLTKAMKNLKQGVCFGSNEQNRYSRANRRNIFFFTASKEFLLHDHLIIHTLI